MKDAIQVCAHQPPLLPCPMCGGRAEVVKAWEPYFVRCAECGLRTRDRPFDRNIDREWNRRAERHARALTIAELVESAAGLFDDTGVAAVWIEGLELKPRDDGEGLPSSARCAGTFPTRTGAHAKRVAGSAGLASGGCAPAGRACKALQWRDCCRGEGFENVGGRLTAALIRVGFYYADLVIDVMDAGGEWRELDRETIERYGADWRIWDKRPGLGSRQ